MGVGISGEEGLQAVNSSDYAIAQVWCILTNKCHNLMYIMSFSSVSSRDSYLYMVIGLMHVMEIC